MLIDSHLHIPHKKYTIDNKKILEEARNEGIAKFITIGTNLKDSKKAIEFAENSESVYATVGVYPHEELKTPLEQIKNELNTIVKSSKKIVGIGECGIDITEWQNGRKVADQLELFVLQLQIAADNNLPVVIHNRNGNQQVFSALSGKDITGVAHCFVGEWEVAQQYLDFGFYISFSGIITYPSGKNIHETVINVPLDRFLLETDAPYLPPQGHRGETNYPKYVRMTAQKVASLKEISYEEVCNFSFNNTCRLFKI